MTRLLMLLVAASLIVLPQFSTAADRAQDPLLKPELQRPVTFRSELIYLGDLLDRLSKECRITLRADDSRDPVSGIALTVFREEAVAAELLRELAILLSTPHNAWEWQREPKGLVLRSQARFSSAAAMSRGQLLDRWRANVRLLHAIAQLPPAERERASSAHPEVFAPGTGFLRSALVLRGVSSEGLDGLLQGREVPINPARFDEDTAKQLRSAGHFQSADPERGASLRVEWTKDSIAPMLSLQEGGSRSTIGGFAENRLSRGANPGWRDLLDPEVEALRKRMLKGDEPALNATRPGGVVRTLLRRHHEEVGLQILFDPVGPHGIGGRLTAVSAAPIQEPRVFQLLGTELLFRRRERVWLLRHKSAPIDDRSHLVPWPTLRRLRGDAARNEGCLTLDGLAAVAELTPAQLAWLALEHPDANPERFSRWVVALKFRDALDASGRSALASQGGLRLRDAGLLARQILAAAPPESVEHLGLDAVLRDPRSVEVRLCQVRTTGENGHGRATHWEVLAGRQLLHRATFEHQRMLNLDRMQVNPVPAPRLPS